MNSSTLLGPYELKLIRERVAIQKERASLLERDTENQKRMDRNSLFNKTLRIILDNEIVTIARDNAIVKVHVSELDGVFEPPKIQVVPNDVEPRDCY